MATRRSRWRVWLAVCGALVATVAVTAALALRGVDVPAEEPAAQPSPLPLPPAVLAAASPDAPAPTAEGVRDAIDELVRGSGVGRVGAAVVDVGTGETLYQHDPDAPAVPASAIKLVTAATVLATRGPAFRIPTVAVAGEEPGEVVLVGGGDPTLAVDGDGSYPGAARLDELAEQVRDRLGDTAVTRVTVDAGLFTGDVHGPWDANIPGSGYVGPITALMTDGTRIDPEEMQSPMDRWPDPDLAAGEAFAGLFDGDVEVGRGTAPAGPAGAIGTAPGREHGTDAAPTGPPSGAPARADPVEPGTQLGRVLSPPMVRLVEFMVADSDNVVAEALARQVALAHGEPASFDGAASAMTSTVTDLGVSLGDSVITDGSGLSRGNRLTAAALTDLLVTVLADPELASMVSGLPVAGWSGTLAQRFRTPQPDTGTGAGVVRAKTGTLIGISSLTGLVVTADGRLLAFALLANDAPFTASDELDRIAATLATCGCR